jgi:ribonuclease VapC
MASIVFDATALLAHIRGEPGSDQVVQLATQALISAVNLAEVISKLMERGATAQEADSIVYRYSFDIVPFDEGLARRTGSLRPETKHLGLSLGDRACLALAEQQGLPALTADRQWRQLRLRVPVKIVR